MSRRTLGACAGALAAVGIYALLAGDRGEARPSTALGGSDTRASLAPSEVEGSAAPTVRAHLRDEALTHARTRLGPSTALGTSPSTALGTSPSTPLGTSPSTPLGDVDHHALTSAPPDPAGVLTAETVDCQFVPNVPDGTTSKFDCALANGEMVRVKYGHEPEIHAEVAATRLLTALGYAADRVYLVPRLRCHGCPPNPFVTMHVLDLFGGSPSPDDDYRDFEWPSVERKFDAVPIEDDARKGWAWYELKNVSAPAEDLDALRLVAVFLAHWDNKAENQRLVCMDGGDDASGRPCHDPLLMINDVGATFGPSKVNLSQWRETPIWADRTTCTVSMKTLPYRGATFVDARVTDAARLRVGRELSSFSDGELRAWFAGARFPQFYAATDDEKDLGAWIDAYRHRVSQILNAGPCPS